MQLDKQQKEDLKLLTEHRGFKILEAIAQEEEFALFKLFKRKNLGEQKNLIELSNAQNKVLGMEYIINTAKNKIKTKSEARDMS